MFGVWWILLFILGMITGKLIFEYFTKKDYVGAIIQGCIGGVLFYIFMCIAKGLGKL